MTVTLDNPILTDEQIRQKHERGYCITDVLFDDDTLAKIRGEFNRLWQEMIDDTIRRQPEREWYARNRPFLASLHSRSDYLLQFLRHPVFLRIALQLVGPDIDQNWNQLIIKPPTRKGPDLGDNTFPWHQDARYALTEPMDSGFTVWLAVTETTVANGTLWVLPDVHKQGLLPHVWDDKTRDWTLQIDTSDKIPVLLKPGQALIFGRYVPHGSGPNITLDQTRMAYQIGYRPPGTVYQESGKLFGDQIPVLRGGKAV